VRAKVGDRVRSKSYPGVSGVVESIEKDRGTGRVIYRTAKGWWHASEVTVEPAKPSSGAEK
jgi:hypothetical protein